MTQTEVVEALKVEPSTVYRWVTGKSLPADDATATRLAKFLGVQLSDLTGVNASVRTSPPQAHAILQEAARLLSAMALATPERRALILGLAFQDDRYIDELPDDAVQAFLTLEKIP